MNTFAAVQERLGHGDEIAQRRQEIEAERAAVAARMREREQAERLGLSADTVAGEVLFTRGEWRE